MKMIEAVFSSRISFAVLCNFLVVVSFNSAMAKADPPITAIKFSPDGRSIVACSQDGLSVFNYPKLEKQKTLDLEMANLLCLAFSPNGKMLAVAGGNPSENGTLEIFSWPQLKRLAQWDEHDDSVRAVTWKDNQQLVTASVDRTLKIWDLEKKKSLATLREHSRALSAVCFLQEQNLLISGSDDHSIRVWNGKTGKRIRTLNQHTHPVGNIALRPQQDGLPVIASSSDDRTLRFWQPSIGRMIRFIRLEKRALDLVWLDETRVAVSCIDGRVRVVDSEEVKQIADLEAIEGWAYAIAVHAKDSHLVVAGSKGQIVRIKVP